MKAKVQLNLIEQVVTVNRNGMVALEVQAKGVCASFTGPDGRAEVEGCGIGSVLKTYSTYSDCPVIDDQDKQSGVVSDLQAMQLLRDALIAMDLGKFEERVACNECSVEFVPELRSYYNVCDACKAWDGCEDEMECAVCGDWAELDDCGRCAGCSGRD
ncbi:MAG: hypothetical protein ACYTFK_11980 [Planctomycetota bacterium]|jgi:hypothetical protein